MNEKYEEIMDLPHYKSVKHKPMSQLDRAAQFASFAALTGHGDMVKEEARLTDEKADLSEDEKGDLNRAFAYITCKINCGVRVKLTVFEPDLRKSGGRYVESEITVKKLDFTLKKLTSDDGRIFNLNNIVGAEIINTEGE